MMDHQSLEMPSEAYEGEVIENFIPVISGGTTYLIRTVDVRKVSLYEHVCSVPGAAYGVIGVVSLLGEMHTLLDLNLMFRGKAVPRVMKSRIIFLQSQDTSAPVGLFVERVLDIVSFPKHVIENAMATERFTTNVAAYEEAIDGSFSDTSGKEYVLLNTFSLCQLP